MRGDIFIADKNASPFDENAWHYLGHTNGGIKIERSKEIPNSKILPEWSEETKDYKEGSDLGGSASSL